jgi:hypothetical protein
MRRIDVLMGYAENNWGASIDDLRPDDEMITDLKGVSTNDLEEAPVA